jgi:transposase
MWWRSTDPIGGLGERKESPIHWMLTLHPGRPNRVVHRSCRRCATARWRQSEQSGWPRSSAVKARTQASNQLKALIVTGSPGLRQQLRHLSTSLIITHCARLRPSPDLGDPGQATKTALRRLARRHQQLSEEITEADRELHQLVRDVAPALLDLPGVGPEVAGQVLISLGDNADRLKSEAAFAHLCGAAPIPARSGRTHRHRFNRGGDRSANNDLYVVVLGRMRHDARIRAYVERRTHEGLAKPEIIRCLKRYVAREIYNTLNLATPAKKRDNCLPDHMSIDRLTDTSTVLRMKRWLGALPARVPYTRPIPGPVRVALERGGLHPVDCPGR